MALLIVIATARNTNWVYGLAAIAALLAMGLAIVRYLPERRKSWYKYLLSQLEAIKAQLQNVA